MCLCVSSVSYYVLFYGVVRSCCLFACVAFACVACGVLCDGVWIAFVVVWLCGWFANMFVWCVYGLCVCCRMDRAGLAVCLCVQG